ncbi:MAG: hypothetical protein HEQ23_11250 [Tepidisphaera sp.]
MMTQTVLAISAGLALLAWQPQTPPPAQPAGSQPAAPVATPPAAPAAVPTPAAQPEPVVAPPQAHPLDRFRSKLERLTPADPESYYNLAEEVADAADSPERVRLAQELFTLAFVLDDARSGGKRGDFAASCCVALSSIARSEADRRWLAALAVAIDPRRQPPGWLAVQREAASAQTAFQAASALGFARTGDGRQTLLALDVPAVRALLGAYDRLIMDSPYRGTLAAIEGEASRWPCKECGNQRIVRKSSRANDYKLCSTCNGRPGMKLTPEQWLAQIRLESLLLSGIHRSWGAQVASDLGEPLRDPDARELPGVLGVDAARTVWRNGAWARP